MVRRYEEPIEVRSGEGAGGVALAGDIDSVPDSSPSAFLWRGRLYVVRDVIGHWRERKAWWRSALDSDEEVAAPQLDHPARVDCLEQEVWRVEASPGLLTATGVYDLANDHGTDGMDDPARSWRLLRVAD